MNFNEDEFYNFESLEDMMEAGIAGRQRGSNLHKAINNGDHSEIRQLLSGRDGVPMEIRNSHGLTPLQVVCAKKDTDMVSALLRSGCNVNAKSSGSEKTALAVAAFAGELEVFELLVNHGANVDVTDSRGWTVLHEAVLGGSTDIVEYIVKLRPKMRFTADKNGRTPLHLAALSNVSDNRMLVALLPNSNVLPSFSVDQFDTMTDLNGRTVLEMAELHHSNFQEWKNILNMRDE